MLKIKIVLNKPFTGMDSGWPVRYIGLMKELSRTFQLSVFAPGNTDLLASYFPSAHVCASTSGIHLVPKFSPGKFFASFLRPNRKEIFLPGHDFCPDFRELLIKEVRRFDASFFFGLDSFSGYGDIDKSDIVICDLCDSTMRHMKAGRNNGSGIKHRLQLYLDIAYAKRIKRYFIPPSVHLLAITRTDADFISTALPENNVSIVSNGTYLPDVRADENFIKNKIK
jgi:hypothetical protein